jgi:hypothetical protein
MKQLLIRLYKRYVNRLYIPKGTTACVSHHPSGVGLTVLLVAGPDKFCDVFNFPDQVGAGEVEDALKESECFKR